MPKWLLWIHGTKIMCEETTNAPFYKDVRRSVLVWSDILGFSDLINNADSGNLKAIVSKLDIAVTAAQKHFEDKTASNEWSLAHSWITKSFTDNLIIAYPIVNPNGFELSHSIYMTAHYQMEMVLSDYFVRGAIAINDTYLDQNIVISKALLEVYHDETHVAKNPRIILSLTARNFIDGLLITNIVNSYDSIPLLKELSEELLIDVDSHYFINYLEIVYNNVKDISLIEKHKLVVESRLNQHSNQPDIYKKYKWCADYHNFFCAQHAETAQHKITPDFSNKSQIRKINNEPKLLTTS